MLKNKLYLLTAAVLVFSFVLPSFASAAQLTQAGIRLGRLGENAGSGGASDNNDMLVTFKLNTTPTTVAKISIFFPSGFTLTAGTPTPTTANFPNTPASITAPPGTLTSVVTSSGAGAGGTIVVSGLTSASLSASTLYGFYIPAGSITNPTTPGQYNNTVSSQDSGGTPIDTTTTPTYITGATPNKDQVAVTASVAPNFSFSLSSNTDTITNIDPSSVKDSTGVTMTVGTNSPLGYTAYVRSKNNSLISPTQAATPITANTTFNTTADAIAAGTTKYGFYPSTGTACSSCTGTLSYDGEYSNGSGGAGNGITGNTTVGAFNGTNYSSFVSRTGGYTNADLIILKERVAVANTIAYANDYADTLTVVAAGNF